MMKTAEAVTPAHPDKVADQISDAVLDHCLRTDVMARVAVETAIGHGKVHLLGEVTTTADISDDTLRGIVDGVLKSCRYDDYKYELTAAISRQSPDIARGVDTGGAGDQGIMVGFACSKTNGLPAELYYARHILRTLWDTDNRIRDAKCQVTTDGGQIKTVLVSAERVPTKELEGMVRSITLVGTPDKYIVNPAGDWSGGMDADAGVTGRKIVQDAYGPEVQVGGGAYSGKDATKVDRSAAYMARHIAKKLLAEHPSAEQMKVVVAYALGVAEPIQVTATDECGTLHCLPPTLFRPNTIIETLKLRQPIYQETARWGAYGNPNFTWEKVQN